MGEPHNFLTIKRRGEANIKIDQKESKHLVSAGNIMFVKIEYSRVGSTLKTAPMPSTTRH